MSVLDEFREQPAQLGEASWLAKFSLGFLYRKPEELRGGLDNDQEGSSIGFATNLIQRSVVQRALERVARGEIDPEAGVILPVAKRPGNPFPDRISIGRAANCDIVLRHHTVSKLHAHLHVDQEHNRVVALTDHHSTNGTFIEGRRLTKDERCALAFGRGIVFGSIPVVYVSAATLAAILASR